jgi:hypothetical protein
MAVIAALVGIAPASADTTGHTDGTAVLKIGSQITVTSSANPTAPGTDVTLSAAFAVIAGNSDVSPTGSVTFFDGATELGTGNLDGQIASWTGQLPLGMHPITVGYAGDDKYTANVSEPLSLDVAYIPQLSIAVTGDNTALPGDGSWSPDIYVSASSDPAAPDVPHSRFTVDFSGISGVTTANLRLQEDNAGTWQDVQLLDQPDGDVTAEIGVDSDLSPGQSTGVTLRLRAVRGTPTGTLAMGATLLSSPDGVDWSNVVATATRPFTVQQSNVLTPTTTTVHASSVVTDASTATVQLTASVSPSAATGTVTFFADNAPVWAAPLSGGIAIASPVLGLGYHTISASYSGDSNYATSMGAQQTQITVTPPGGNLHTIVPVRLLDTRNFTGVTPAQLNAKRTLDAGKSLTFQVTGLGGVPGTGVAAVSVNVTVVQPTGSGFVTLYPAGGSVPGTANIDFPSIVNTSGLVITPVSATGQVTILNRSNGTVSLIADVSAWFAQQSSSLDSQGRYNAVPPLRILDTRFGTGVTKGRIAPGQTISMKVAGMGSIPATGVGAAMLNVTIVNPTMSVYLVLYPTGGTLPHVSTNAFQKGETRAARVVVGVGPDGKVNVFSPYATADVVVDIVGWFSKTSSAAGGASFIPLPVSQRLTPAQTGSASWTKLGSKPIAIAGVDGIPAMSAAIHPSAVVTNLHVSASTTGGYLFAYPAEPRTSGSDLNFLTGQVVQNLGVATLASNGAFLLFSTSQANVTIDIYGWFG